jgi:hypothetical protein
MKHLDEGAILSVRDGEDLGEEVREHLAGCATCAASLAAARARAESIVVTLTALDRPIEPTAAKVGVRARLRSKDEKRSSRRFGTRHLGRAAALLLVSAGAAAAVPGSPLRSLWSPTPTTEAVDDATAGEATRASAPPAVAPADVGITVAAPDGAVQVVVRGATPGTEVSVSRSDQSSARITAPPGSRITYAAGRVEVDASRGSIHNELPRRAGEVSLEVDGRLYLEGSPEALTVPGPAVELTEDAIRFLVSEG